MRGRITLIFFICCLLVSPFALLAQDRTVTGKVTDKAEGQPLPGVTVTLQGTSNATVTDATGSFTISAPVGGKLIFTQLGMTNQVITIPATGAVNVALVGSEEDLSEVVVIGYGTQKKSVTTGAISSVKASDLENMPVLRVEQALQGRASGLTITTNSGQPGEGSTLRVRGTTSINGSDPLYVVDGVIVGGGIDYLNQADIESIEVLKDAASAAIYGARAAAGVILVTTKKGSRTGGMRVNYNGYLGTQAPERKLTLLNATQYATLYNEAAVAGGGAIRYENPAELGAGTDWQDAVFNDEALIHNQELSISGGSEKSIYYGSFGYWDQEGIVASDNSRYKRFTARFNSEHKITNGITFGNTIGYTRTNNVGVGTNTEYGSPLNRAINLDPITPLIVTDPNVYNAPPYSNQAVVRNADGFPYGISSIVTSEILNPIAALAVAQGNSWSDKVVASAFVDIEFIKGLKFRSTGGVDLAFWGSQSFNPIHYLNSTNQNSLTGYTRNSNRGLFYSLENILTYNTKIQKHNVTGLVGYAFNKSKGESQGGTLRGIPVDNLRDASLAFSVPQTNQYFGGGEYANTITSFFGRLIYDYDEKYLFTGILRQDGSSKFGPNYKYGYFPSASAGWVASREGFWPENKAINFLKIRGSYGVTGSNNIEDFRYLATIGGGRNYTIGTGQGLITGFSPNALSNPDLQWEETTSTNIGFESRLFNDFSFTFDWYTKKTKGMLLGIDVPMYVGNNGPVGNIADMSNKGLEFELGYNKQFGEVSFSANANASFLKNTVDYLGNDKTFLNGQTITPQALQITRTALGQAVASFYGFEMDGLFQNQNEINSYTNAQGGLIQPNAKPGDIRWRDLNADGVINEDDRTFIGDPTPNFSYGLTLNAAYKSFDFIIFGQGVAGNQIFNGLRRFDLPSSNYTTAALQRWTGEGTSNFYPRLTLQDDNKNFSRTSALFLEEGAYFRIKTVQLGYTLPVNLVSKIGLNKVRFYVMGNNLLTFTKYSGFDPEIGGGSYGVDRGFYPQARTFFAGINVGF